MKVLASTISNNYEIAFVSNEKLKVDGIPMTVRQFATWFAKNEYALVQQVDSDRISDVMTALKKYPTKTMTRTFEYLAKSLRKDIVEDLSEVANSDIFKKLYDYSNHSLVIDVMSGEKLLFNKSLNQATRLDIDSFRDWANIQPKVVREAITEDTVRGAITYNPYDTESVTETILEGQEVSVINSHVFPQWRKREIESPEYPSEFKEFMEHFFPCKESRAYVLDWMHYMLVSRNECHLLLHGKKGTGKGTFSALCRQLVGTMNYKTIDIGFWDNRFNKELKNNRLCYFDEHDITRENKNRLKAYANPTLSIEEKGKNVGADIRNHASYIISNNNAGGNFLEMDDRRFSVPVTAKEKLEIAKGEEWIKEFNDLIEEDELFIANIGKLLLSRKPTHSNYLPFKSDVFYMLVNLSLTEWQRKLISKIEAREYEEFPMEDINSILDLRISVGSAKISSFLENHVDRNNNYYAKVVMRKNKKYIVPYGDYAVESEQFGEDLDGEEEDF